MRASEVTVKIRRSAKFVPFIFTGMVLGIIAAFIVNAFIPDENRTPAAILGFLVLYFAAGGLGLGVLTAIVFESISVARAKTVEATKLEL
jgi:H+/Cl- antiporter ClcA